MDVVRRNIETLRGKVEVQSTPGKGSTFTIRLPLTLLHHRRHGHRRRFGALHTAAHFHNIFSTSRH